MKFPDSCTHWRPTSDDFMVLDGPDTRVWHRIEDDTGRLIVITERWMAGSWWPVQLRTDAAIECVGGVWRLVREDTGPEDAWSGGFADNH